MRTHVKTIVRSKKTLSFVLHNRDMIIRRNSSALPSVNTSFHKAHRQQCNSYIADAPVHGNDRGFAEGHLGAQTSNLWIKGCASEHQGTQ